MDGDVFPHKQLLCGNQIKFSLVLLLAGALNVVEFPRFTDVTGTTNVFQELACWRLVVSEESDKMWSQAYAVVTGERKEYAGTLPLCNKCKFHHNGPCTVKCANCKRVGHLTRDCWSSAATNNQRPSLVMNVGTKGTTRELRRVESKLVEFSVVPPSYVKLEVSSRAEQGSQYVSRIQLEEVLQRRTLAVLVGWIFHHDVKLHFVEDNIEIRGPAFMERERPIQEENTTLFTKTAHRPGAASTQEKKFRSQEAVDNFGLLLRGISRTDIQRGQVQAMVDFSGIELLADAAISSLVDDNANHVKDLSLLKEQ
ncbi:reverse transcriptase domain-containing protein [Tanacetum coccineum]